MVFVLKSVLSDMSIATPAFIFVCMKYLFPSPHFWFVCVSIVHFLLSLRSILSYTCTTVGWMIHPLKDIWIVSSLGLLRIKLLWTFVDKFLRENKFSFLWDKCPRVQLLGAKPIFSSKRNCQTIFQRGRHILPSHQQYTSVPVCLQPCQHLLSCVLLIIAILLAVKRYFVVLICISLKTNG